MLSSDRRRRARWREEYKDVESWIVYVRTVEYEGKSVQVWGGSEREEEEGVFTVKGWNQTN
jgi:hypothetical protein